MTMPCVPSQTSYHRAMNRWIMDLRLKNESTLHPCVILSLLIWILCCCVLMVASKSVEMGSRMHKPSDKMFEYEFGPRKPAFFRISGARSQSSRGAEAALWKGWHTTWPGAGVLEMSELNGAGVTEAHGSEISGDVEADSMD